MCIFFLPSWSLNLYVHYYLSFVLYSRSLHYIRIALTLYTFLLYALAGAHEYRCTNALFLYCFLLLYYAKPHPNSQLSAIFAAISECGIIMICGDGRHNIIKMKLTSQRYDEWNACGREKVNFFVIARQTHRSSYSLHKYIYNSHITEPWLSYNNKPHMLAHYNHNLTSVQYKNAELCIRQLPSRKNFVFFLNNREERNIWTEARPIAATSNENDDMSAMSSVADNRTAYLNPICCHIQNDRVFGSFLYLQPGRCVFTVSNSIANRDFSVRLDQHFMVCVFCVCANKFRALQNVHET